MAHSAPSLPSATLKHRRHQVTLVLAAFIDDASRAASSAGDFRM
jgi:hypothetical protein